MDGNGTTEFEGRKRGGSGGGWIVVFAFLLLLPALSLLMPGSSGFRVSIQGETLLEKLSSIEQSVESLPCFEVMRKTDQRWLVQNWGVGNSRVVVGKNDWLHYRADIESVIGKGPFYEEPPSVARAPGLETWNHPGPVILEFQKQLQERGIELWLVPVPTKSMVVSLGGEPRVLMPAAYRQLLADLKEADIRIFDPFPLLSEPGSFLRRDTHWTPGAMTRVARALAAAMTGKEEEQGEIESRSLEISGDLTEMLLSGSELDLWRPENVVLSRMREPEKRHVSDPASPWVLLGDSFVNIYDDPSLGFPDWTEGPLDAGFASSLSRFAGRPLHVIAMNGGGATGVRSAFASLPDDVVRRKEKVIWVLSARDLMLSELPGRRAGIRWAPVEFNEEVSTVQKPIAKVILEATLREKSVVGDPETTPYDSAVYSAVFDEVDAEEGDYSDSEAYVFLWAFRNRELDETALLTEGQRYRIHLVPFPTTGSLSQTTQLDDFFRTDLTRFFAESIEKIE